MIEVVCVGKFIHSLALGRLQWIEMGAMAVDQLGRITAFDVDQQHNEAQQWKALDEQVYAERLKAYSNRLRSMWSIEATTRWIEMSAHQFMVPGFIDTHTHAPQYVNSGIGLDLPLLDWLNCYTFPRESEFKDVQVAERIYPAAVRRHLSFGTTTCCYYGTIHLEATKRLVDVIEALGQRAFVGKVCMDRNAPEALTESTQDSIANTQAFVAYVESKNNSLITPILTPRFVPSCTSECMHALGRIAKEKKLPIQSHLSENVKEIQWVQELYPEARNYTSVYDSHGLLTDRTIMAHAIHLSQDEKELLRDRGTGVSHCPNSNFGISSGVCHVRGLIEAGVKVGLGTDVSGGHHPSMMDAIKHCVLASKVLALPTASKERPQDDLTPLTVAEAFHLATMGSAEICGIHDRVGNFVVGKEFDAVLVDMPQLHVQMNMEHTEMSRHQHGRALEEFVVHLENNVDLWHHDDLKTMFEKFIYLGDDRNIAKVWVKGRLVKGKYDS